MNELEFKQIYNLLEKSFEPNLYREFDKQKKLLDIHNYNIITYKENDKIIGFLSYWEIDDDTYFVEHFAVSPEKRGAGIGKKIFNQFLKLDGKKILEVEPPHTIIDEKRIKLYESFGLIFHQNEYYQPPYKKNDLKTKLHIMCTEKLDEKSFDKYVQKIYSNVYNVKKEDIF